MHPAHRDTYNFKDTLYVADSWLVECQSWHHSEMEWVTHFIEGVSSMVNWVILGDERNPANWRVPIDNENKRNHLKEIGDIMMSNVKTQKVMENLKEIIEVCIP